MKNDPYSKHEKQIKEQETPYTTQPVKQTACYRESIINTARHAGYNFINSVTPCVTFDKISITWNTIKGRPNHLTPVHDGTNREAGMSLAGHEKFTLELFFQDRTRPSYQEPLRQMAETH